MSETAEIPYGDAERDATVRVTAKVAAAIQRVRHDCSSDGQRFLVSTAAFVTAMRAAIFDARALWPYMADASDYDIARAIVANVEEEHAAIQAGG